MNNPAAVPAQPQAAVQRVGILGGTFDPLHCGHVALASGVADALGLRRVLFMPTGNPNFKRDQQVTPARQRVEMVARAIAGDPRFELDTREVERAGVTYTADTLAEMHAERPDAELFFIIGADSAETLPHWRRAEQLAPLATFVAVQRPGYDFARVKAKLAESPIPFTVRYLELATPDISSTRIRAALASGQNAHDLLPPPVSAYIAEHRLYTTG